MELGTELRPSLKKNFAVLLRFLLFMVADMAIFITFNIQHNLWSVVWISIYLDNDIDRGCSGIFFISTKVSENLCFTVITLFI